MSVNIRDSKSVLFYEQGETYMKARHIFVLIAMCGLAAASIGVTVNTAGVFFAPMAESLGVGRGSAALALTITSIVAALAAMGTPKLLNEKNLKLWIIIATAMLAGSCVLISMCDEIWLIYALSVVRGIGDGMINFVMITMIVNYWFYARRGTFTSIVMAFSGVPGVILSPIFSSMITASGWRNTYLWVGGFTLLCCLPAIVLPLTIRPETAGVKPYGYEEFMAAKNAGRTSSIAASSTAFNFFSVKFILAVLITCAASMIAAIPSHLPGYAVSIGKTAELGALMLSISMGCNILFKLCYGVLNDKFGAYKSVLFMSLVNLTAILLFLFVKADFAMYIGSGFWASIFAIGAVGIAMLSGYLFGMENYASAYPVLSFLGGVANAAGATLVGSLYDMTGSYVMDFWLAFVLSIVMILSLFGATAIRRNERHSGIEAE